jgi:hypothetical protein
MPSSPATNVLLFKKSENGHQESEPLAMYRELLKKYCDPCLNGLRYAMLAITGGMRTSDAVMAWDFVFLICANLRLCLVRV